MYEARYRKLTKEDPGPSGYPQKAQEIRPCCGGAWEQREKRTRRHKECQRHFIAPLARWRIFSRMLVGRRRMLQLTTSRVSCRFSGTLAHHHRHISRIRKIILRKGVDTDFLGQTFTAAGSNPQIRSHYLPSILNWDFNIDSNLILILILMWFLFDFILFLCGFI